MSTGGQQEGSRVDSATAHTPPQHTLMKLNAERADILGGSWPHMGTLGDSPCEHLHLTMDFHGPHYRIQTLGAGTPGPSQAPNPYTLAT